MIKAISDEVTEICFRFQKDTGIEVSPQTREIAAAIISAITEDPHPQWKVSNPQQLQGATRTYLAAVPMMLHQIVVSEKVQSRVNSFDFLHWWSKSFGPTMCIIPK